MENANHEDVLRQWILKQTAHLDPPAGWRPDPVPALRRFRARMESRRPRAGWRRWPAWAAAAALLLTAIPLMPQWRIAAQQLWQYLTVSQVAFLRVHSSPAGVPSPQFKLIGTLIPQ